MAGSSRPIIINGWPAIRWSDDEVLFHWKTELRQVFSVGTNNQAAPVLGRLGINKRQDHLHILDQPVESILKRSISKNRHALNSLPMVLQIPREKMEKELPWMQPQGYFSGAVQLDTESLWRLLLWAAEHFKSGSDPKQTILEQISKQPNRFGILDRSGFQKIRDCYSGTPDPYGWHQPLPSQEGRVAMLSTLSLENPKRVLVVLENGWQAWLIGSSSPATPHLPVSLKAQGDNLGQLQAWLQNDFHPRKLRYLRKLQVDPASIESAFVGARRYDPGLKGSFYIGSLARYLVHLIPDSGEPIRQSRWDNRIRVDDYSSAETIARRAEEHGLVSDMDVDQMREALAQKALEEARLDLSGWDGHCPSSGIYSGGRVDRRVSALEAAACQSLPSGLIIHSLPALPSRLQGRMTSRSVYRPLNPFCGLGE